MARTDPQRKRKRSEQLARTGQERKKQRPEQISLPELVNKLGHPRPQVGRKVAIRLIRMMKTDWAQREPAVSEVARLVTRPNISERAQKKGLHVLNQVLLGAGEMELAMKLIDVYLVLLRSIVGVKRLENHRFIPLLIRGINRAFPYASGRATDRLVRELDFLYLVVHTSSKSATALSALKLLYQVHYSAAGVPDRFYSTLYRWLLGVDPVSVDAKLFEFLLKVVGGDASEPRVRAFVKRLLQISLVSVSPAFPLSTLLLCSNLARGRPNVLRLPTTATTTPGEEDWHRYRDENEDRDEDEHYEDVRVDEDEERPRRSGRRGRASSGWLHRVEESEGGEKARESKFVTDYRPDARNPLFARADFAEDVELLVLARHYHPEVALYAQTLLQGRKIPSNGGDSDPTREFSSRHMLDKVLGETRRGRGSEAGSDGEDGDDDENISVDEFDGEDPS